VREATCSRATKDRVSAAARLICYQGSTRSVSRASARRPCAVNNSRHTTTRPTCGSLGPERSSAPRSESLQPAAPSVSDLTVAPCRLGNAADSWHAQAFVLPERFTDDAATRAAPLGFGFQWREASASDRVVSRRMGVFDDGHRSLDRNRRAGPLRCLKGRAPRR
jgi:hypothetical protein